ncbi:MAG: type I methionyl aminopeptidase [Deltaproteobacteria bacterium]|nr:type I methionyl aminopeptidase [Deltaproteobacteria bacterium]
MSIRYKSESELAIMRDAGLIAAEILETVCQAAKPGVSTWELDQIARRGIEKHKVTSAFLGYNPGGKPPYPGVLCTSRNEVIVHGIPRKNDVLADGDIIGIDFGIFHKGFCADTARTLMIGSVSPAREKLVEVCRAALEAAIALCVPGNRLGDIGSAVQTFVESKGFSVVRQFVGHGIGRAMHEDPQVPNFGKAGTERRLKPGLVIAVEPMVNAGAPDVEELDDDWTAVTKDRSMSAHFEHTIAVTEKGPWVLTRPTSSPGSL